MAVASLEDRYRAATEAVALLDRSQRGKLALSGSQAVEFLDSLLSNDIAAIGPGHGATAALLTHKGRLLAEVRVLATEAELELDCERPALQALFDALNGYRIGYDAELHKRTLQRALLSLIGPASDALFDRPPGPAEHDHVEATVDGRAVRLIRTDLGIDVLCASDDGAAVAHALAAAGAQTVDEETAEIVRVEAGRPRFGVEIDETTMPQEAGIHERAVSYSKGCYVGQETVARLYWKGNPNRHLRGLRFAQAPQPGAALTLDGRAVGAVASIAHSPRFGTIGLALLRREAEPGATLEVSGGGSATVADLPFGR
ncbi:MAG TPA: glycine cleavage T C-terminal barrel domain-containing protein [Solirubrobacteraceae bacterium]